MIIRILTAVVIVLLAQQSLGRSYYVSSVSGDDHNPGSSPKAPWRTLARVNNQAFRPGDTIRLERGGEWHGPLKLSSSGRAGMPITVAAYGEGPRPIIGASEIGIDNNEQSHIVYTDLDVRASHQGLRLYSWKARVEDITLQGSIISTKGMASPQRMTAGVYASTKEGVLSNIVIRNNFFYPHPVGLENWAIYFVRGVTEFRIEQNFLGPAGEDAITIWHCSRGTISGNRGGGNGENTIDVKDSQEILIADNVAVNDREYNIVIHRVDPGAETHRITVRKNHCIGGGQGLQLTAGIALLRVRGTWVSENHIEQSPAEAILIVNGGDNRSGSASQHPDNVVERNYIGRNSTRRESAPIVVQDGPGTVVRNNFPDR